MKIEDHMAEDTLLDLTALIVANHVGANNVSLGDVPILIKSVHETLKGLGTPKPAPEIKQEPAVSIKASVKPDYLVSLESGKKMKMLKRYLMTSYGMTPADYRKKWGLPADYPMVAPNYAAQRKELAVKIGLGRKPAATPAAEPRPKAAAQLAVEPVAKAMAKPAVKRGPKAAASPVAGPEPKAAAKAVEARGPKAASKPAAKPSPKAAVKPAAEPVAKPVAEPAAKRGPKAVAKPAAEPTPKVATKLAAKPVAKKVAAKVKPKP